MTLPDPETHLPDALRDSKLPWLPDDPHQARCPRCGDGWKARLGELRFELTVDWDSWRRQDGPSSELPEWQLRLVDTHLDREKGSWAHSSLETSVQVAESIHELLLDELLQQARHARTHRDAA